MNYSLSLSFSPSLTMSWPPKAPHAYSNPLTSLAMLPPQLPLHSHNNLPPCAPRCTSHGASVTSSCSHTSLTPSSPDPNSLYMPINTPPPSSTTSPPTPPHPSYTPYPTEPDPGGRVMTTRARPPAPASLGPDPSSPPNGANPPHSPSLCPRIYCQHKLWSTGA